MEMFAFNLMTVCVLGLTSTVTGQKNDKDMEVVPVGGASILEMGRSFKDPLLRLLGTAMLNEKTEILNKLSKTENKLCSLSRCDEWSQWSRCTATIKNQFGMVQRSRQCGRAPAFCPPDVSQVITTESDSRVCVGKQCPDGFTQTENGFCLLLHEKVVNRTEAEEICKQNGTFVINTNSELKSKDLHDFLTKNSITGTIWLNGRRESDVNSPWVYSYESGPGDYDNWYTNEPSKGATELCMVEEKDPRRWFDRRCYDKNMFVCELV